MKLEAQQELAPVALGHIGQAEAARRPPHSPLISCGDKGPAQAQGPAGHTGVTAKGHWPSLNRGRVGRPDGTSQEAAWRRHGDTSRRPLLLTLDHSCPSCLPPANPQRDPPQGAQATHLWSPPLALLSRKGLRVLPRPKSVLPIRPLSPIVCLDLLFGQPMSQSPQLPGGPQPWGRGGIPALRAQGGARAGGAPLRVCMPTRTDPAPRPTPLRLPQGPARQASRLVTAPRGRPAAAPTLSTVT